MAAEDPTLPLPRLGWETEGPDLSAMVFDASDRGYAFMAWGVIYFTAMGLAELRWLRREQAKHSGR